MTGKPTEPIVIDENERELIQLFNQLRQRGSLMVQIGDEMFRVAITPLQISPRARRLLTKGGPGEDS